MKMPQMAIVHQSDFSRCRRDSLGDSSVAGDSRWAGSYGVNVDFVARSHCSVAIIGVEGIQVSPRAALLMFSQSRQTFT